MRWHLLQLSSRFWLAWSPRPQREQCWLAWGLRSAWSLPLCCKNVDGLRVLFAGQSCEDPLSGPSNARARLPFCERSLLRTTSWSIAAISRHAHNPLVDLYLISSTQASHGAHWSPPESSTMPPRRPPPLLPKARLLEAINAAPLDARTTPTHIYDSRIVLLEHNSLDVPPHRLPWLSASSTEDGSEHGSRASTPAPSVSGYTCYTPNLPAGILHPW